MAYMDYMNLDVRCPRKAVKLNHSLAPCYVHSWMSSFNLVITVTSHGHHGVSNHQQLTCLINRLFRRTSKTFCEGNPSVTGGSPHKRPVTRQTLPFDDVIDSTTVTSAPITAIVHYTVYLIYMLISIVLSWNIWSLLIFEILTPTKGKSSLFVPDYIISWARLTKAYDVTIQRYRNSHEKIHDSKMHILRCMGSKFCGKFQRCPLKFHTKFWTHTPQNMHFMRW